MDRSAVFDRQQRRRGIRSRVTASTAVEFFNLLTDPELLQITEDLQPEHRERLYPPTLTLSMFIGQALQADRSCQNAVNGWALQRLRDGLSAHSVRTGGYCRARQRLPLPMIRELARHSGRRLSDQTARLGRWRGYRVKLVDGTCIGMPDTAANQAEYPQPHTQAAGLGFPLMRIVTVICLSSGALLEASVGRYAGVGQSEVSLFRSMLGTLSVGDVVLADRLYCDYFLIAHLQQMGVEMVSKQHGARRTDFRRGIALGRRDHQVCWQKPERPGWMSPQLYASMPACITVREVKVRGRILVTTLLKPRRASREELGRLYERRWNVELDLRNIKSALGLQLFSCKTPQMVLKELWVYLLAYNLVRILLAQAGSQSGHSVRQLSFKHALRLWSHWQVHAPEVSPAVLFALISQQKVGQRPGRIEPRARKRRPKHYELLNIPRALARAQLRVHRQVLDA